VNKSCKYGILCLFIALALLGLGLKVLFLIVCCIGAILMAEALRREE
jgi:hypothetical protein